MRVLIAHNRYQQRGGEDVVVDNEFALLERSDHVVERFLVSNDEIVGVARKFRSAVQAVNNPKIVAAFAKAVSKFSPDIVHFHNIFPRLTPGAVLKSLQLGIPTIQTLHNFRLVCANAQFLRNGKLCEACLGGSRWPGIFHRCYRGSAIGSLAVSRMGRSFRQIYDRFPGHLTLIALTEFAKSKLVADGYDPCRIVVKGNATPDSGGGSGNRERRIVFVGRLSKEKGADLLVRIANRINADFEIIGDGPELESLRRIAPPNVTLPGWLSHDEVLQRIKTSAAVAMPSRWYEGFAMVIVEAFATATPVLASRLGAIPKIVRDGQSGLTFAMDDEPAWEAGIRSLIDDAGLARKLGIGARAAYEAEYSEPANLKQLVEIYEAAIGRSKLA
jgi:glycosyltransferase involved in cell wall biosynthesis